MSSGGIVRREYKNDAINQLFKDANMRVTRLPTKVIELFTMIAFQFNLDT